MLEIQPSPPACLVGSLHTVHCLPCEPEIPVAVPRPGMISLRGVDEPLLCVLANRLQEPIAEDARLVLQRLLDDHH